MGKIQVTVKAGDHLTKIAAQNKTDVETLQKHNPQIFCQDAETCIDEGGMRRTKDGSLIYPGEELVIPSNDRCVVHRDVYFSTDRSCKLPSNCQYIDTYCARWRWLDYANTHACAEWRNIACDDPSEGGEWRGKEKEDKGYVSPGGMLHNNALNW